MCSLRDCSAFGRRRGALTTGMWATVTAQIKIEHNKAYKGEGPVLYVTDFSLAKAPKKKVRYVQLIFGRK